MNSPALIREPRPRGRPRPAARLCRRTSWSRESVHVYGEQTHAL